MISSCSKDESYSDEVIEDEKFINQSSIGSERLPCSEFEMLIFADMTEFENAIGLLNDGMPLPGFNLNDFYSLNDYYSDEGVENIDDLVYDYTFASLLSGEGEVKIGDRIYKVSNSYVIEYDDCDGKESSLKYLKSNKDNMAHSPQGEIAMQNEQFKIFIPEHENVIEGQSRASEFKVIQFEKDKFLVGQMWSSNWFFYASIGVRTVALKKKKFLFWTHYVHYKMDRISVSWDVHFNFIPVVSDPDYDLTFCRNDECNIFCDSNLNDNDDKSKTNSSEVKKLFDWSVGIGVSLSGGNFTGVSGLPGSGTFFNYWRHRSDQNTLSNHSAVENQSQYSTSTNFWKECP